MIDWFGIWNPMVLFLIYNTDSVVNGCRCTTDDLVPLETVIREAFIRNEHLAAIFFDPEKAYDTMWKYGIMRDLHDLGLKGRLPHFISGFYQTIILKSALDLLSQI